MMKKTS